MTKRRELLKKAVWAAPTVTLLLSAGAQPSKALANYGQVKRRPYRFIGGRWRYRP